MMSRRVTAPIDFDVGWNIIQTGITKLRMNLEGLLDEQISEEEYLLIISTVYNMCQPQHPHDYCTQLLDIYTDSYEDYTISTVLPSLRDKYGELFLRELVKRWTDREIMDTWASHVFFNLDARLGNQTLLYTQAAHIGMIFFQEEVYDKLKFKARDAVIIWIDQEREGKLIDRALVKKVLRMFVEMDMGELYCYRQDFEEAFLDDTSDYYYWKAKDWIVEYSCADYMLKVEQCLDKEEDRVCHYLHPSSEKKLLEVVRYELLVVYAYQLLVKENSGFHVLLRYDKVEDLLRMYRLFLECHGGLMLVANMFKQHVFSEGMVLMQQAADAFSHKAGRTKRAEEQELVTKLNELHDKYNAYITDCFSYDSLFHKALKEAFEDLLEKEVGGTSCALLLDSYCDKILKKGRNEKLCVESMYEILDKVVKHLPCLGDKDIFDELYRKKLSCRLLFDRGTHNDHESFILKRMKHLCGHEFTSKMDAMFADFNEAQEIRNQFQEYLFMNEIAPFEMGLTATVIKSAVWPSHKPSNLNLVFPRVPEKISALNLPAEMVWCDQVFREFHVNAMELGNRRKFKWSCSLGSCNIMGNFEHESIELIVGTHQAAVLMLFDEADRLSYSEIRSQLDLDDDDLLVRLLHSLSCAKYKILNKEPDTKSVSPTDSFEFNSKFTHRMSRIRIPLPILDERIRLVQDVYKNRRCAIEIFIVRVLKVLPGIMGQEQLLLKCVEFIMLKGMFKPDLEAINQLIEDLIPRVLERDQDNTNLLRLSKSKIEITIDVRQIVHNS